MLIVKKFGGTSVANKERIYNVANRCVEEYKKGNDVVVVLSAMGKYTDELISMAEDINEKPPKREMDMLFTIGEQMSVSLMAMAFDKLGVPAVSLNAFQVAMHTTSVHGNARLKRIDTERIRRELENHKIVVVTGFQGVNKYDDYTTLGRGGSDTTAVALAAALHADACEIYTDVDGVYTIDPRLYTRAKKLKSISYEEMMQMACLGAGVLETRSVELASKYNVPLFLGKALETDLEKGTWIMHKELEDMPITGLSVKDDYAIMRFMHLPNDGVYLGKLFKMISDLNINLDTISQQLDDEGLANFTLYCSEEQSNQIMEHASKEYPVHQMLGYIKLSLVGLGISTHSGIASKVLNILSENGIKYYMITSSEISISLTIEKKDKVKAVQALGKAFDL